MTLDLAIPHLRKEVALCLPSPTLYQLEQAGSLATEILDERVTQWAEEGWAQRRMADEMGCSQQAVSNRLKRLGIQTEARKRGEGNPSYKEVVTTPIEDEDVDEADVEIIDEDHADTSDAPGLQLLIKEHNTTGAKITALWEKQNDTERKLAPLLYALATAERLAGMTPFGFRTDYKKIRERTGLAAPAAAIRWMMNYAINEEGKQSLDEIARTMPDDEWGEYMEGFCTSTPEGERTKEYLLQARSAS